MIVCSFFKHDFFLVLFQRLQSGDFSDITNWPTPGELAKEVRQTHTSEELDCKYRVGGAFTAPQILQGSVFFCLLLDETSCDFIILLVINKESAA